MRVIQIIYIRKTTGVRHKCSVCGAKRNEKFLRKTGGVTKWAQEKWECADQYCGKAWINRNLMGRRSVVLHGHGGHPRSKNEN